MKQFLFVIMMLVAGFAVKAQTTTIVNNTNCKFKIVHQSFTATCAPFGTPAAYNVPPFTTIVVPALPADEVFSVAYANCPVGNTTVGVPPCHAATAAIPPAACCTATSVTWNPITGTLTIN